MTECLFEINETHFLYARPSLIEGIGRSIDLGSTLEIYNDSPNDKLADLNALTNDWIAIGKDLANAMIDVKINE